MLHANCGTYAGYQYHKKHGEDGCEPCRVANSTYQRDRRRDPKVRQREYERKAARERAVWRLAAEYPGRFRELVEAELAGGGDGAK